MKHTLNLSFLQIGPKLLTILITMGLNLKHISLGMHTAIRLVPSKINSAGLNKYGPQ